MEPRILEKDMKKGRWSKEEHHRFLACISEFGRDWKSIQARLSSRSLVQIRSHAQKYLGKTNKNPLKLFCLTPKERLFKDYFVFLRNLQTAINPQFLYRHMQQTRENQLNSTFAENPPPNIRIE